MLGYINANVRLFIQMEILGDQLIIAFINNQFRTLSQMEIPSGNFFEVSINSSKLYSYLDDIFNLVKTQQSKMDDISKTNISSIGTLSSKLKKLQSQIEYQSQKNSRKLSQQLHHMNLYVKDIDKKCDDKLEHVENLCKQNCGRIAKFKESIDGDVNVKVSYLDRKISNVPSEQEVKDLINRQAKSLEEDIQLNAKLILGKVDELSKAITAMQVDRSCYKENMEIQFEKVKSVVELKSRASITPSKSNIKKENRKTYFAIQKSKGSYKDDDECSVKAEDEQAQQNIPQGSMACISSKSINSKLNRSVVKSKVTPQMIRKELATLQHQLNVKIKGIQELVCGDVGRIQKELGRIANKNYILDQHIGIITRKMEKEKYRIQEFNDLIRKVQDRRIEEKSIENMKNMMLKLSKDYEESLLGKITQQSYDKDKTKLTQKIDTLATTVSEKAEKADVKKGFTFFQQKIKEIIIVLAEEQNIDKDGALKRMQFKCLSCDKQLQNRNGEAQRQKIKKEPSSTRCGTNYGKKRIKVINTFTGLQQEDS